MPGRLALLSEAFADRWQKNALLLAAVQPGKPWATPLTSATGVYAPAPSPLMKLSPSATAAVGGAAEAGVLNPTAVDRVAVATASAAASAVRRNLDMTSPICPSKRERSSEGAIRSPRHDGRQWPVTKSF